MERGRERDLEWDPAAERAAERVAEREAVPVGAEEEAAVQGPAVSASAPSVEPGRRISPELPAPH